MQLLGIDFSSAPSRKKPVAVAHGRWEGQTIHIDELSELPTLAGFEALLQEGPFVAAIDMPFGLSRQLVDGLKWPGHGVAAPSTWGNLIDFYGNLSKEDIRATFKAWCDARPAGKKFAHRACDTPAGSSPSMKWVNPPVAFMLQVGAPLLKKAGVHIPGMQKGDAQRVAIEAYPGFLARQVLGRQSYKTDTPSKDSPDRKQARNELVCALEDGMLLGIRVNVRPWLRGKLIEDAKADLLDSVLCCLVAGWCEKRSDIHFGLPPVIDPVEGWIAPVPFKVGLAGYNDRAV
ncbi:MULTISPECIES: DUF429 domain-containing protein [Limnobacter]|uniref:DUF429 domain-containing protein n=1 Tax=Limnobacter litoralis TaxID=481366 RepID=A0ABQ5YQL1_9BURK|nr:MULTISPECIES: DUF429 domain-containing protein [Limnobacter]GLR25650.1 hypothetical protein GCM10007875_07380 [Limnobacter litoralis]HEX5484873.1 DUF429 domain-containing protein [Limnobacter sp.]